MRQDRILNALLAVIAALLLINRGATLSPPAHAQAKPQYMAVRAVAALDDSAILQQTLDQMSAKGWEYVGVAGDSFVFKK